ncbi:MAG: DUF4347 domain-containing protein [Magnetococcales bacterium]|nr:DUF4347 domain-containing protein [Magnetococcales bacterium]
MKGNIYVKTSSQIHSAPLFDLGGKTSGPLAWPLEPRLMFDGAGAATLEVVYVDADHVAELAKLESLIRPGVEVVRVAGERDGWHAMAADLQGRSGLTAIHVVGHGAAGRMTMGNATLDADALETHAEDLATIGRALTKEGDLLLYGCDVGRGEAGRILVDNLARLTGADVAASIDPTGATRLGGNWSLERTSGPIESAPLLVRSDVYDHLLPNVTFDFENGGTNFDNFGSYTFTGDDTTSQVTLAGTASNIFKDTSAGDGITDANIPMTGWYPKFGFAAANNNESKVTVTPVGAGVTFNVSSIGIANMTAAAQDASDNRTFTITPYTAGGAETTISSGVLTYWHGTTLTPSWSNLTKFEITGDQNFAVAIDTLVTTFNAADTTAPRITSIVRQDPATATTDADSLKWRVTFDETVYKVTTGDFSVSGTTATVTNVSSAGGNAYDVTVSGGDLANLNGTATLAISGAQDIVDAANNALANTTPTGTNNATYTMANYRVTSDGGSSTASVSVAENGTSVTTVTTSATTQTFSIDSGADAALFSIDASSGILTFKSSPNYESPTDANGDNQYIVVVKAVDSSANSATQTITVSVTNVNETPSLTSSASFSVAENTTAITTLTSTDPESDSRTYTLTAGDDVGLFALDASTGVLSFKSAPNYESPLDANTDNKYELVVKATDSNGASTTQAVTVTVTNVKESTLSITSNGGRRITYINMQETITDVTTVTSSDSEGATRVYAIDGGVHADLFTIDASSGKLSFKNRPDYENPWDKDKENRYVAEVKVTDSSGAVAYQTIVIRITDKVETPPLVNIKGSFIGRLYKDESLYGYEIRIDVTPQDTTPDKLKLDITLIGGVNGDWSTLDSTINPNVVNVYLQVGLKKAVNQRSARAVFSVDDGSSLVFVPMDLLVPSMTELNASKSVALSTTITTKAAPALQQNEKDLIAAIKTNLAQSNPNNIQVANRQLSIGSTLQINSNYKSNSSYNSALDGWDAATFTLMGAAAVWARNARKPSARPLKP